MVAQIKKDVSDAFVEKEDISRASVSLPAEASSSNETGDEDDMSEYKLSWRTLGALIALSLSWAVTSFAVVGPNSTIGNIIADFPGDEAKATWIANAGLFCLVTLPTFSGTFSDRYGKKWFVLGGAILGVVGCVVSGTAKDVNTIIGGQAITGVAGTMMIVGIAASMEIVPAKYRGAVIAGMAVVNGTVGVIVGSFTCKYMHSHRN
jgi:MFS family permease